MTQPVKFGLNVDPNTGGLPIAERITAIADEASVMGLITAQDRDAFNGPVERWAETLTSLHAESQMNAFVFWPSGDRERQSRLFAEQVVHAVRESLARLAPPQP